MHQMLSGLEHGGVNRGVRLDAQRTLSALLRCNETPHAAAFRHAKAPLVMASFHAGRAGLEPNLEDLGRVHPRYIRFAVANSGCHEPMLELACLDARKAALRVLIRKGSLAHVGDDLAAARALVGHGRARSKTAFIEAHEGTEITF